MLKEQQRSAEWKEWNNVSGREDPYSKTGGIVQASRNFRQCQLMAGIGRRKAIIRHNKPEIKNQYVNIYKQIINKKDRL